jgi:hypothetical protein
MRENKSQKSCDELFREIINSIRPQLIKADQLCLAKENNPFRPFVHEKDILFNCIDRSLMQLPEMYFQCKDMDAEKTTSIVDAIERLLEIRKQFITDYWSKPFVLKEEIR